MASYDLLANAGHLIRGVMMGSDLKIPRPSFAMGAVGHLESMCFSRGRVAVLAISLLVVSCIAQIEQLHAQEVASSQSEKANSIDVLRSPFGHLNNVGLHVVGATGIRGELAFELDGNSRGIRIAELNTLLHPEIQSALELTDEQLAELNPVFEQVAEFQRQVRWDHLAWCEQVRTKANDKILTLSNKLGDGEFVRQVLLPHQYLRLIQIERRFIFNVHSSSPQGYSDQFFKHLKMDRAQAREFGNVLQESIEETLEDNAKWESESLVPMLKEMFTGKPCEDMAKIILNSGLFSSDPVIRHAQMSPLFLFSEIEQLASNESALVRGSEKLDLALTVFDPVIVVNGRFAEWQDFRERDSRINRWPRWKHFLIKLKLHFNDWLELSEEQRAALEELYWIEKTETGSRIHRFFGDDRIREYMLTRPDDIVTEVMEYNAWKQEFLDLNAQIDEEVGERVKAILLPFQREQLQFAIGAGQLAQLGIWHLLEHEMLGSPFRLESDQLAKLEEEVSRRRKVELDRLVQWEMEMLDSLAAEQQSAFKEFFGEPVPHLPTMLFAFREK